MYAFSLLQLYLGLTPLQTGELHITGLAYSLSAQPSTNQTTEPSTNQEVLDGRSGVKRPVSLGSSAAQVQGMQDLDIQGPRMNITKDERCGVLYGPDRRLDPIIAPPMPLLEVGTHPNSYSCINPILTGLFQTRFLLGGGQFDPPPKISAVSPPIAAKICMHVK